VLNRSDWRHFIPANVFPVIQSGIPTQKKEVWSGYILVANPLGVIATFQFSAEGSTDSARSYANRRHNRVVSAIAGRDIAIPLPNGTRNCGLRVSILLAPITVVRLVRVSILTALKAASTGPSRLWHQSRDRAFDGQCQLHFCGPSVATHHAQAFYCHSVSWAWFVALSWTERQSGRRQTHYCLRSASALNRTKASFNWLSAGQSQIFHLGLEPRILPKAAVVLSRLRPRGASPQASAVFFSMPSWWMLPDS
jgi:hypothetical protein